MNMESIKTKAGHLLAVGILGLVCTVAWFAVFAPAWQWSNNMTIEKDEAQFVLSRLEDAIALTSSATSSDSVQKVEEYRADFLKGEQDQITVADLQTRISAVVSGNASELNSASNLQNKEVGGQSYLGLRLQIRGDMKNIQKILYTLEYDKPYLFIERAELRLEEQRGAVIDNPEGVIPKLIAEFDVFGAKWPAPSPDSLQNSQKPKDQ